MNRDTSEVNSEIVVLLGTHRSGTSLTARIVNSLGVRLGDTLLPGRADNPAGFCENRHIIEQTRNLDGLLGVDPFGQGILVPVEEEWWKRPAIRSVADNLKRILHAEIEAASGPFAFKDPRTLYLLPLWRTVFLDLGVIPSYVLALRHPASVVISMTKRGISHTRAELTWLSQLSAGLSALHEKPHCVVHYERWFDDAELQVQEIAKALGISVSGTRDEVAGELKRLVQPRFGRQYADEGKNLEPCSSQVGAFYDDLYACAQGTKEWKEIHSRAVTVSRTSGLFQPFVRELQHQPAELQQKNREIQVQLKKVRRQLQQASVEVPATLQENPVEHVAPRHPDPYGVHFPGINAITPQVRAPARPLRVCIATEDIVGPIRNGGIGTTYTHLALLLAEAGHETTIFYLRGGHTETGDIREWVDWYRERGVRFVPVDDTAQQAVSSSDRWIRPMYALYRELQKESYDLVHASEWRASAYMCLLAKEQGLAFQNTVFCIKTSSPWLWNREVGLRPMEKTSDLLKIYAERRSVEMADLVIGGGAYLLRWMLEHGYRLPSGRTFVQPNVIMPVGLPDELRAGRPAYGSRAPVKEIVFFGRLEHRKGLHLFCEAINSLLDKGCELPPVTFMGKFGARIPTHPKLTSEEFIHEQAAAWPMEWRIVNDFNQFESLVYLHGEGRLAVMPSMAENSTLTVYETTHFAIPFIASDVGGTSELVSREHRKYVLVAPHPVPIADKLREVLDRGALVAAPSFDNDANLGAWINFHSNMSIILDREGWPPRNLRDDPTGKAPPKDGKRPTTTVCLVLKDDPQSLGRTIDILLESAAEKFDLVLVDDGSRKEHTHQWLQRVKDDLKGVKLEWQIFKQPHFGLPVARNFAASKARGDYVLFIDPGAHPHADTIDILSRAAAHSGADILLPFYDRISSGAYANHDKGTRIMFLAGDPSFTFYQPEWRSPLLYVRKETFQELQGFATDYKIPAAAEEFLAKAILANKRVTTVPEGLATQITDWPEEEQLDEHAINYRTARPYIQNAPLCYQPFLVVAKGLDARRRLLRRNNEKYKVERRKARQERDHFRKERDYFANLGLGQYLQLYALRIEKNAPTVLKPVFSTGRSMVAASRGIRRRLKRGKVTNV